MDQDPNFDYLGHPLDAYHFVRHVATGWERVREELIFKANSTTEFQEEAGENESGN